MASSNPDQTSTSSTSTSKYVTLVSSDGLEYVVLREAACHSGAIKRMLDVKSGFQEAVTGRCNFQEIKYVQSDPLLCEEEELRSACQCG